MSASKKDSEVAEYLTLIEDMLDSGLYNWAEPFLSSVYADIEKNNRITERQKIAVDNVYDARKGH